VTEDLEMIIFFMAVDVGKSLLAPWVRTFRFAVWAISRSILIAYFKQLFAQVTNRRLILYIERMVMSLTFVGNNGNLLNEDPLTYRLVYVRRRGDDRGGWSCSARKNFQASFTNVFPGPMVKRVRQRFELRLCRYKEDAVT